MKKIKIVNELIKSNNQKEVIKNKSHNLELFTYLQELFKDQIEENTLYKHLILTEEQYDALDDDVDFDVFGNILISVEFFGELEFLHYFDLENMESIKEKGLLVSYSKAGEKNDYRPDLGYGIYVVEGDYSHDMPDNLAELFLNRYDEEDEEVGYVQGLYKGKYLRVINSFYHDGYCVLKEDVSLDMIREIDSDYLSSLAKDYYEYLNRKF